MVMLGMERVTRPSQGFQQRDLCVSDGAGRIVAAQTPPKMMLGSGIESGK